MIDSDKDFDKMLKKVILSKDGAKYEMLHKYKLD